MALAGPLLSNGQPVACPKCGAAANHQLLRPKRHDAPLAVIRCRCGREFTNRGVPVDVINRVRFAKEGQVKVATRSADGQALVVTGVMAKDSMADPKGNKAKGAAVLKRGAAASRGRTPAVPGAPRRPAGGGGALAASINLLAAGLNTVSATVGAVGQVAGAAGQVAGAVATTANAAARVGGEGIGLARDGVKAGTKALDGKIKAHQTAAQHNEAARIRTDNAAEKERERTDRARILQATRDAAAEQRMAKSQELREIRQDKAVEKAREREDKHKALSAERKFKAAEKEQERKHKRKALDAERKFKAEQAQLRRLAAGGSGGAEKSDSSRTARRRRRKGEGDESTQAVPAVDLSEYA
jgi:hypothetical protein